MLPKPTGCLGCPFYGDGLGFVPDEVIPNAKVKVYLQNPGEQEEQEGKPAVGPTGQVLNQTLLPRAGLSRGLDVSVCNALRCRYNHQNKLPRGKELEGALKQCRQYDSHDSSTQLTVAAGAAAWQAFNGPGSITDWRGFLAPQTQTTASGRVGSERILGTLHPADLFRNPKMRLAVMNDWQKVKSYLEGTWPQEIPPFVRIPQDVSAESFYIFVQNALTNSIPWVVVDTEFTRDTRYLTALGISYPGCPSGVQIWFSNLSPVDRHDIRDWLLRLISKTKVVFQNAFADIPVLERNLGIKYTDYVAGVEDTMLQHAVLWSDWPHTLEFLASMYGKYEKMKHLSASDPSLYNWGDVVDTICVHEGLQSEFRRDNLSKCVYETQSLPLIPILLKRMKLGIRVNKARVEPAIQQYKTLVQEARLLARAYAGWPINIGSDDQLKGYLYDYLGLPLQKNKETKKPSTNGDAIATLRQFVGPEPDLEHEEKVGLSLPEGRDRIHQGANGVLEGRVIYAAAGQVLSHYLLPLVERAGGLKGRIYPDFKIHAQASGRWSITDPPLAQLPEDLRDIIIPDEGMAWIAWDWDQIELRLLAALANDTPYLEAFKRNEDVHTLNARAIFDDPTIDKNDPRRVFAKRFVYRLNYGGEPRGAGNIPGAKQLGLVGSRLVDASNRYLAAHPAMARWREGVAQEVRSTGVSRTFMGRRRRFLGDSMSALREAYNHPMQGGVADILNTTTIQIAKALPYATLVYTCHDSAFWEVEQSKVTEAQPIIKEIVEQTWNINSLRVSIPAKFKPVIYG